MKKLSALVVVLAVFAAIGLEAAAPLRPGKSRLASTRQIMTGFVHPNQLAIEKVAQKPLYDAKSWEMLGANAAMLNEASYILMEDGRCPDADWEKACQKLRTGSAALLAKIEARDAAGVATEYKAMAEACVACHAAHR